MRQGWAPLAQRAYSVSGAGPENTGALFKIPDCVADLFDDDTIRVEFQQTLSAAGQVQGYVMKYLEEASFSEAAGITYGRLEGLA